VPHGLRSTHPAPALSATRLVAATPVPAASWHRRVGSALVVALLLGWLLPGPARAEDPVLEGARGGLAWRVLDLRHGRERIEKQEHDLYSFILLVRRSGGPAWTVTRYQTSFSRVGWLPAMPATVTGTFPLGTEEALVLHLVSPATCLPLTAPRCASRLSHPLTWKVSLSGTDDRGRSFHVSLEGALPRETEGFPAASTTLEGRSGPFAWRARDFRHARPSGPDGERPVVHEITLVLRERAGRGWTVSRFDPVYLREGWGVGSMPPSPPWRIEPGGERVLHLAAPATCLPVTAPDCALRLASPLIWSILMSGTDDGGRPFTASIALSVPLEIHTPPPRSSPGWSRRRRAPASRSTSAVDSPSWTSCWRAGIRPASSSTPEPR
jgi:hypothetical protein